MNVGRNWAIAGVSFFFLLSVVTFQNCGGGSKTPGTGSKTKGSTVIISPPLITAPADSTVINNQNTLTISGTCIDGDIVRLSGNVSGGDVTGGLVQACASGGFSFTVQKADDGTYSFQLTQIQGAVESAANAAIVVWTRDTSAPSAPGLTVPAGNPFYSSINDTSLSIQGTCETGATVNLAGDSASSAVCSGGTFSFSFSKSAASANDSYGFSITQTDIAGNTSPATLLQWMRQDVPPMPVITSPAASPLKNNASSVTISGTCVDGDTVTLGGADSQTTPCTSSAFSFTVNKSADGLYVFSVTQSNNVPQASAAATLQWLRDTTAPAAPTITGPGASPYLTASSSANIGGGCEPDATVTMTPPNNDPQATQICPAAGTYVFPISVFTDGNYIYTLQQVDPVGNTSASVTFTYSRDTSIPSTPVIGNAGLPDIVSNQNSLTLFGTCTAGLVLTLGGDDSKTVVCAADGSFSMTVTKTNAAGTEHDYSFAIYQTSATGINSGSANVAWHQDLNPPAAPVIANPNPLTLESSGNTFVINGGCENAATVTLSGDESQQVTCTSSAFTFTVSRTTDKTYNFSVAQTDPAGNTGASVDVHWIRNSVAPAAPAVLSPATPITYGNQPAFSVSGTCGAGNNVHLSSTLGDQDATCSSGGTFSFNLSATDDGTYALSITQTHADLTSGSASLQWILDRVAPQTTITHAPATWVPSSSVALQFTANEASAFECNVDSADWAPCVNGATFSGLADGAHTIAVRATDLAGNVEGNPQSVSFNIDTSAPLLSFDAVPPLLTNKNFFAFSFSADDNGTTFECSVDNGDFAQCTPPVTVSQLGDGTHSFVVRATNLAGLVTVSAPSSWRVDTTPPVTTISKAPANWVATSSVTFEFSANEDSKFDCSLDGDAYAPCDSGVVFDSLTDAAHSVSIRATDLAGNVETNPPVTQFNVATAAPVITFTLKPSVLNNKTTATFGFTSDQSGATFECSRDGGPFASCVSPVTVASLTNGAHAFTVRATNQAGVASTSGVNWTVDIVPPVTTITSGPASYIPTASATLQFTASESATFQCSLDGSAWAPCVSGVTFTGLSAASHKIWVMAADQAGNVEATPPSVSFTVQTSPPAITFSAQPKSLTNQNSANFAFTADQSGTTFKCSRDGTAYADCTSPVSVSSLADGTHGFTVLATNLAGLQSTSTVNWKVDTTPPVTTITQGPAAYIPTSSTTLQFNANESSTFQCSLDGGAWNTCASGVSFTGLSNAAHKIYVRATDDAGNVETAPPSVSFTVQTTGPIVTFSSKPATLTNQTGASFAFSADQSGTTFKCSTDGAAFADCASPITLSGLANGAHSFTAKGTNLAGLSTDSTVNWTIDIVPPVTTITQGPAPYISTSSTTLQFTASESATFKCQLDGGSWNACTSGVSFTGLSSALHKIVVQATDDAGNVEANPPNVQFTVQTSPPVLTFTAQPNPLSASSSATFDFSADQNGTSFKCSRDGSSYSDCTPPVTVSSLADGVHGFTVLATNPAGLQTTSTVTWTIDTTPPHTTISSAPAQYVPNTSVSLQFSANETATFQCQLDSGSWSPCASGVTFNGLSDAPHTITVQATDTAGNVEQSPPSVSFTVESTPPAISFTTQPPALTNQASANFDFSANQSPATFQCSRDGAAYFSCTPPVAVSSLANGIHTFTVKAANQAGAYSTSTVSWTVDLVPPVTTITSGPSAYIATTSATLQFTASESAAFKCSLDDAAYSSCVSGVSFTGLSNATHKILVQATDLAGNTETNPPSVTFTVQTSGPVITVSQQPATLTNQTSATFAFTADQSGTAFQCSLDGGSYSSCTSPATVSGLSSIAHAFTIKGTNLAGLSSTSTVNWTVDTTPPVTTITSAPGAYISSTSATLQFTANETSTFQCQLDSGTWTACTSGITYTGLANGAHKVSVQATDQAGNTEVTPPSAQFTVQSTAPVITLSQKPATPTNSKTATFAFTADQSGTTFQCSIDGAAYASCTSPVSYSSLTEGTHSFGVKGTNQAGLTSSATTYSWTTDLTAPNTNVTGPASTITGSITVTLSSSDSTVTKFDCSNLDATSYAAATWSSCTLTAVSGGYQSTLTNIPKTPCGNHSFYFRAVDPAGNVDPAGVKFTFASCNH